jgi:hypothetical protein
MFILKIFIFDTNDCGIYLYIFFILASSNFVSKLQKLAPELCSIEVFFISALTFEQMKTKRTDRRKTTELRYRLQEEDLMDYLQTNVLNDVRAAVYRQLDDS